MSFLSEWHVAPIYVHTVARGSNIFFQIMVTFLSYISNACHSLSGVAERLQHTYIRTHMAHGHLLKLNMQRLSLFVRGGTQSGSNIRAHDQQHQFSLENMVSFLTY